LDSKQKTKSGFSSTQFESTPQYWNFYNNQQGMHQGMHKMPQKEITSYEMPQQQMPSYGEMSQQKKLKSFSVEMSTPLLQQYSNTVPMFRSKDGKYYVYGREVTQQEYNQLYNQASNAYPPF
jgi:hypothetical protein